MKTKKLLSSALVVGALAGALTLSATNSVNAYADIEIDGSGDSGSTWSNGVATNSGLYAYGDTDHHTYTDWTDGGGSGDTLTVTGGSLIIDGMTSGNKKINASGGNINIDSGTLNIDSDSSIEANVNLAVGGTLRISGGSVVLNSGDSITGNIDAQSGSLTVSGGDLNLGNSEITNAVFSVTGGKATFNSASNIHKTFDNAGTVVLKGGNLGVDISNTGTTEIAGTVTNSAAIGQKVDVTSGKLTTSGSVSGKTTITNDATVDNTGTLGAVENNGTFNVNGGQTGAVANNSTMTVSATNDTGVGAVTNDGKLNISGGKIASVTNKTSGTNGTSQTDGTVTTVSNTDTGAYTQSGGTVTSVNNAGTYNLTGGTVTGTTTNSGTFNLKNSGVSDFKQSSGTLNITGGGSLALTSATNTITGGTVNLGDATSIGTLNINNGLTTNTAKVVTTGASVLNVQNGTFTTGTGSAIADAAAVTIGTASDTTGTLNVTNGSAALGTNDNWNTKGTVNVNGGELTLNGVTQNGTFSQISGTTIIGAAQILTSDTTISDGNLNITGGNLTVNGENAVIGTGATVDLASGKTLNILNTKVAAATDGITLDSADTWAGNITQSGGLLTIKGRTGSYADSTTDGKTLNITDGNLVLNNSSLTLNKGSKITGATVTIDPSELVFNNGEDNTAKILMKVNDNSSLTIKGAETAATTLTLLEDSDIDYGTVTVGDGENENILNISNNANIAAAVNLEIKDKATANLNGATAELTINSGDTINGTLAQTNGTLTVLNDNYTKTTGVITSNGGVLNIGDGTTSGTLNFNNADDLITAATVVTINSNSKLAMSNGNAVLDGGDTATSRPADDWSGAIEVTGGTLKLSGRTGDVTTDTKTYNQTGGKLIIDNGGSLTLNTVDSKITSTTTKTSEVVLGNAENTAGTLVLNNGTDNSAQITNAGTGASVLTLSGNSNLELKGDSAITSAVALTVSEGSTLNIKSTKAETNGIVIDGTNDNWSGIVDLDGGTLTILGSNDKSGSLDADAGTLNIGNGTTAGTLKLNNAADDVADAVYVKINADSKLAMSNGNVVLDGGDTATSRPADDWSGAIEVTGGTLKLSGRTGDVTTDTKTYNQAGGTLTLDNSSLSLHDTTKSQIKDGTTTYSTVNLNNGSTLTFDNGTTLANAAVIKSDTNDDNAITVGGDNGAKLTLKAGATTATNSDIDANTAVTISANGELTTYGDSIKGDGSQNIKNDGIFNLSNNGDTSEGILARAINNAANDGTKGTVNLTGTTRNTAYNTVSGTIDATIDQAYINVGDDSGDAGSNTSVFTMGANVTANTMLTVNQDGKIQNGTGTSIVAQAITVDAGATITGITSGTTATYGNMTVKNGGSNAGTIEQNDITLTAGTLDNTGSLTANGYFTNHAVITDSATPTKASKLNINGGGISDKAITQNEVTVTSADTAFDNKANLTATKSLTNSSTINNTSNIYVQNAAPATTPANLKNTGTINSKSGSTITADTLTNHDGDTKGKLNLTNATVRVLYQSDDIKGVINTLGTSASTDSSVLELANIDTNVTPNFAGELNVGDTADTTVKSALTLKSGNVVEDAIVSIATGNVMNVDDTTGAGASSLVLDDGSVSGTADVYAGDLNLVSGSVDMRNLSLTTGDVSTTAAAYTGTNPYYKQSGGALTLTNTTLSMVDSSLISNPTNTTDLTVDAKSTFNSLSNAFSVENLTTAGLINGINGGYENYAVQTAFNVGENSLANQRNQADFNIDIYARNNGNNNYHYDSFGSDSDTISAVYDSDGDGKNDAVLYVSDWTLNGDIFGWDAPIDRSFNLDKLFKGTINATDEISFTSTDKEVFTPIGWYGLHSAGSGNYTFSLNRYNPGVFRGQVSTIAQYQNQLMIDDMLFNHSMLDNGFKGNDYIASNPNRLASATDLYPPYQYSRKDGGLWVKMYGTFEKLNMNQGLHVGNNAYGTIIGADFGLKDHKHGWQFMPTAYVAYNGAHQYWQGYGNYQNGGQLGFMGTWYKNDFMIGALAYGGVYGNQMSTPRGDDDAFNYFAGGSVKTAYNWRFARNWALQPNLLVAYNFFGQQNWHSDFGQMGMMSGMLHGVNIAPGVNLIWEKETFSIYGTLQYMYNLNQSVGGRAGNVDLPNVHMDRGYIQYGLGFNKRFGDRFSGFLQAVIRNVGRTGIGLQAGFQWQLGKGSSNDKNQKGNVTPELKKADIKLKGKKIQ